MEFRLLDTIVINLTSGDDEEHIQKVVEYFKNHLDCIEQSLHKNQPLLKAICAGLQASDEVIKLKAQFQQYIDSSENIATYQSTASDDTALDATLSQSAASEGDNDMDTTVVGLINSIDNIIADKS